MLDPHRVAAVDDWIPVSHPLPGSNEARVFIPKGTLINVPINVIQADKRTWGPDAALFRPERWESIRIEREREANSDRSRSRERKDHSLFRKELMVFGAGYASHHPSRAPDS